MVEAFLLADNEASLLIGILTDLFVGCNTKLLASVHNLRRAR